MYTSNKEQSMKIRDVKIYNLKKTN